MACVLPNHGPHGDPHFLLAADSGSENTVYKSPFTPPKAMSDAMLCILSAPPRNSLLSSRLSPRRFRRSNRSSQPFTPGRLNIGAILHRNSSTASQLASLFPAFRSSM